MVGKSHDLTFEDAMSARKMSALRINPLTPIGQSRKLHKITRTNYEAMKSLVLSGAMLM